MSEIEALIERHQRRVFTFACYFLSEQQEAEDVTQEVLIKLWRKGRAIDPERREAWLLRVTRNACYDRLRQRRSSRRLFVATDDEASLERATSDSPDPEQRAWAGQIGERLAEAVTRLGDSHREVLILREVQGLSYQEIADVLGLSLASVKVTLHRARKRLRELLEEEEVHVASA